MLNHSLVPVGSTGGYSIDNSLRFNDDDNSTLTRTLGVAGNLKTWTFSCWFKLGSNAGQNEIFTWWDYNGGSTNNQHWVGLAGGQIEFKLYNGPTNTHIARLKTTQLLRDTSAWYNLVVMWDTSNATSGDRLRMYLNGSRVTSFAVETYPALNTDGYMNSTAMDMTIGAAKDVAAFHVEVFDGYLAEVNFVDGQALTPSDFGETDATYGHWKPIEYAGTYGTNGFYLDFKDSGSLGNDANGSNNWATNNLAATDQMLDSPTNNFCTLNPLNRVYTGSTFSEGNTKITGSVINQVGSHSSMNVPLTGKWYAEFLILAFGGGTPLFGINHGVNSLGGEGVTYRTDGAKEMTGVNGNTYTPGYGATWTTGDVMAIGYDADSNGGQVTFYKNGVSQGVAFTGTNANITEITGQLFFGCQNGHASTSTFMWNFGQDSSFAGNKTAQGNADGNGIGDFYYTPPTGFLALCTQNLPEPTVVPSEHFNTVLYTGTGAVQSITGVGFTPDFTWIKGRSYADYHASFDTVRGATKSLSSNLTGAEVIRSNALTAFGSDGFTLGYDSLTNSNGNTIVSWNWKANGAGVSNTDGTITSTVSANVDAGFSIVKYTGTGSAATVGHGLSQAPEMIIQKCRTDGVANWASYIKPAGTGTMYLNLSNAYDSNTVFWNGTAPTTSLFSLGTSNDTNGSGDTHIAYAFHSVEGYSKVGSYTGNGSADGTFIYTGFRPAFIMTKASSITSHWEIHDIKRGQTQLLFANLTIAEINNSAYRIDSNANGVKIRNSELASNGNGETYIYIAFAEHPMKYSNAR